MKLKHCSYQDHDLPISEFTSTRAKYCNSCKRVRELELAKERRSKQIDRLKNKKSKKKVVKSIAQLKKHAQKVFNAWIRQRDGGRGCISCGKEIKHAGHYVNQGSSGYLRYDESNVHGQCVYCNVWARGNLIEYRINLVKKIGLKEVERLEHDRHKTKKWQRDELEEIIERYK